MELRKIKNYALLYQESLGEDHCISINLVEDLVESKTLQKDEEFKTSLMPIISFLFENDRGEEMSELYEFVRSHKRYLNYFYTISFDIFMDNFDFSIRSWLSSSKLALKKIEEYYPTSIGVVLGRTNFVNSYRFNFVEISRVLEREDEYIDLSYLCLREFMADKKWGHIIEILSYSVWALHVSDFCRDLEDRTLLQGFMKEVVHHDYDSFKKREIISNAKTIDSLLFLIKDSRKLLNESDLAKLESMKNE